MISWDLDMEAEQESVNNLGNTILSHHFRITKIIFSKISLVVFQVNILLILEFVIQDSVLKKIEIIMLLDIPKEHTGRHFISWNSQMYICHFLL